MRQFAAESARFNLRVAGVCIHDGHVLLHRDDREDFWVLPGGRPLAMEASPDALRREMAEEIGVDVAVGGLLWVVENFFAYRGEPFHEVALYFAMRLPADAPYLDVGAAFVGHEGEIALPFRWFPLAGVDAIRLYPTFLSAALSDLPEMPRHIVHWDE